MFARDAVATQSRPSARVLFWKRNGLGILFLRFYLFCFTSFFFFYLSPAENGEILPSPDGSTIHLSICKSSWFQSQEQEQILNWDG